jgi:hypothetical protein
LLAAHVQHRVRTRPTLTCRKMLHPPTVLGKSTCLHAALGLHSCTSPLVL